MFSFSVCISGTDFFRDIYLKMFWSQSSDLIMDKHFFQNNYRVKQIKTHQKQIRRVDKEPLFSKIQSYKETSEDWLIFAEKKQLKPVLRKMYLKSLIRQMTNLKKEMKIIVLKWKSKSKSLKKVCYEKN